MDEQNTTFLDDLRGCSFEQFVTYAFDRPVPQTEKDPSWWFASERESVVLLVDPSLQVDHARRLFADPELLQNRFTPAQIDQGFWFLAFAGIAQCARFFAEPLWTEDVELDLRCRCVRAMFDLYEKLFATHPTETATYMWWDLLASCILEELNPSEVVLHPVPSHEAVRREMVETLRRILALDARHCREAALHGLNHVAIATERAAIIDPFLAAHTLDEKLTAYARLCRAGRAP